MIGMLIPILIGELNKLKSNEGLPANLNKKVQYVAEYFRARILLCLLKLKTNRILFSKKDSPDCTSFSINIPDEELELFKKMLGINGENIVLDPNRFNPDCPKELQDKD